MTDFKKGGPLQNSNIYATNRLFVKNPLFKKKKKKRAPGVYNPKAKFKYEDGGSIVDLTEEEIQKYIDGGYVVEEVNDPSIPALTKAAKGGSKKGCPEGYYWDGTKCTKLITLKNDKKYIDGVANWAMHVSDPNMISGDYNDQIKDRLYSGKWGLDPETGALVKLSAVQPKSVTTVDAKTKASREKEKLAEKNYRAEEENKKAYEQSIIGAGFDPATFGKAKGINTITGEPIYASSKEEADRINQEAINQAAIEGHAAVVNNPVFKTAANFTPVGMAVGAIEGLARFIPDAYTLAQDPTLANAGQLGMDALQAAPLIGKPLATATGKAFDYVKNMEPVAPGPMMLLGRTGSTNMVKKNMNYYKQLLDSYDSKKMSSSDKKFYNSLIETGKKQDGMVTEAQVRELDRLKTGNFDFGKKGYSLNFEQILKLPDEDILNKTGKSKEDWELFIEAKPDKYGKALEDTYNSAYNPTQEQLANIEAGKQQLLDFYSSGEYNRRLQNGIPGLSFMDTHNYQNNLINAINKTKPRYVQSKNYGTLESDAMAYTSGADASGTKLGIDFSSTGLSRPDAKYLASHEYGHASLYDDKNKKLLENLPKLSLDEETLKNWTKWGKESGNKAYDDMINYYSNPDEARQRGINAILYSKEAGISTDDLVDMPYNQVIELSREGKIPKDIAELRQIYNQKELKDYLKKLYSIGIPTAGVIGTATMLANPFEGSDGLPQQKKGGSTNDYIEIDIPEEEIQWYIDQGYIVEPVSKLKKFIQGGTLSDMWYQYTGTPWSEAKAKGLTDGSFEQNLALAKRLEAGEFGEPKIVDTKPTPTVTSYDKMVFALVKQGNSLDDLVKQKIGTREGLIFKYPELFANKKNVSAPKKSGPKPKKGTTIMEQFDALSKFASPYIDKVGDAVSTAYDSWINRMSKISEQEKKAEQLKKFTKPTGNQKQVIQPYDIEALKAQLTQSNAAGAPPSLTRQPSQQPLGNNSFAAQFAEYGQRGQGIEMNPLKNVTDNNVTLPVINNKTKEEPFSNQRFATPDIEKEIFTRQEQDNMKYGKFMGRGKNIANRTDVQRNVDSEKFFADIASPNSVIIDIGSALGNTDPKLAGVSVWELTQNPKIKQKKIKVIATDIPEQVNTFKQHSKDKKAYNIDYAEVPMTFNTPVDTILKSKNLTNTKDIYLRAANSIDLLMTPIQTKEHFDYIAKTLKNKNVTYVFNNIILFKPAGKSTFTKLGNINNAAYDHNAASWTVNKDRKPYKLLGKE